ncbi:MAG: hypothetical protein AAFN70_00330, partial [Planctomycetota bacterium]
WVGIKEEDASAGDEVIAEIKDQTIHITTDAVQQMSLFLDDQLLDLDQPINIQWNDQSRGSFDAKRTARTILQTLRSRGDKGLAFSALLNVRQQ